MYIYKFTHKDTGRVYIGQTIQNPNQRRLEHISGSRYSPYTHHFHNALRKYGIDAFDFEVIAEASSLDELNILEAKYVDEYDSINTGFNIREAGGNKKHNPESIKRMSESQKATHAKRRAEGREGGWVRKDGGCMKGKSHPNKGGTSANKGKKKGMTWEEIYGVEGARIRRENMKKRKLAKIGG